MFVFYDIETSGIDIVFDQILQFGAILTDENLVEVDRFEIRCQLLPWIVPSPKALLVTATPVQRLEDGSLPDFYTMMQRIGERLNVWGAATFVGYNSMRFDEPFLQRAFWQALLPPYLTVTGGNARFDLLPIIRATAHFRPGLLSIPSNKNGKPSFRLDALAPASGFNTHRAHDAMGDVEATLFLARKIARGFPELWRPLSTRASKAGTAAVLAADAPVFLFRHGGNPSIACYRRIDNERGSYAVLARLDYDWASAQSKIEAFTSDEFAILRSALRRVALNKAPVLLTLREVEEIAGVTPVAAELAQADLLSRDRDYGASLAELIAPLVWSKPAADVQVEEMIFDGFANASDVRLMAEFQRATPSEQLTIARTFSDSRFRRLAMRILYVRTRTLLGVGELEQIRLGIQRRLNGDEGVGHRWRSISDAIAELIATPEPPTSEEAEITAWLANQRMLSECTNGSLSLWSRPEPPGP